MAQRYTTKADIEAVIHPLYEIGADIIDISARIDSRKPRFEISLQGLLCGEDRSRSHPEVSAHRRLELEGFIAREGRTEYAQLEALFAHVPPLRHSHVPPTGPVRKIKFEIVENGWKSIRLAIDNTTLQSEADDPLAGLIQEIYTFLRIHENLEMGPALVPWKLHPQTGDIYEPIWADTADNALLRFAACNGVLRRELRQGVPHHAIPQRMDVPAHILDAINRKTRKAPAAPRVDWDLLPVSADR